MTLVRPSLSLLLVICFGNAPASGAGDGYTAEEAVARMVLPAGFHAEVFASEPMIRQPVAATFDERGRMWVIEYLQYPVPAGLKPVSVDQYLRTEYDKIPEPPPRGPRGADRIKILEDTDDDGKADKSTIFLEGLNLASAIAIGEGGVFVGQAPYLLFYPDRDRDDRPDGDPEVLLTGFGLQDAHATVNSMTWGPDGWLYGVQGSTVTAKIRGIEFQQGIWRYHPRTKVFELFAEGGGNTWGLDFDFGGNAFGSSNGGFIAFHMEQGGNYWKGFAKHGALHNPNAFGYFNSIRYEGPKIGGHVTPGGIIYKGDAYPESFRGKFIGGNLLSNAVYWHELTKAGSTFVGKHGGTLIDARDNWFRPIDLLTGPDGCVYVVDWYDKRASHLDPRDNWDRANGRIYRIVHGERPRITKFDLTRKSTDELLAYRTHKNEWWAAEARRQLIERKDQRIVPQLTLDLASEKDETFALRDLWLISSLHGLHDELAFKLLHHPLPGVRRWTIRLLGDEARINPTLLAELIKMATTEPDPTVRCQLAASCQRWPAREACAILTPMLQVDQDAKDEHIPLMLWWAFERQWRADRETTLAALRTPAIYVTELGKSALLERVARLLASSGKAADDEALAALIKSSILYDCHPVILGMDQGLQGRALPATPACLVEPLAELAAKLPHDPARIRVAIRLASSAALAQALMLASDSATPKPVRLAMIDALAIRPTIESESALITILKAKPGESFELATLNALGRFRSESVTNTLIDLYPNLSPKGRELACQVLASRRESAGVFLTAIEARKIAVNDVTTSQVLQIAGHRDAALTSRIEALWGKIPGPNSDTKRRRIAEIRGVLPEGDKGNPLRGVAVFKEQCASCHKLFGEGELVGPELTGAERSNLDFLLTSLVDPSAVIRKEYQSQAVALTDGRTLSGLVTEETANTLTLFDSDRRKTTLSRDFIEAIKTSDISLMPEGMLDKLTDDQVRDLFRYLQSSGPAVRAK